ncbi:P-loop containing nucleoside triphosphate hydrolase protein [Hypoxylon sp. FL0543]|nr:P-loop containing nucleoside triphosphate hydrolase protein [Hypoxylon sp. FL0543]
MTHDKDDVLEVMQSGSCSEQRAIDLLTRFDGDVNKAKQHQIQFSKYYPDKAGRSNSFSSPNLPSINEVGDKSRSPDHGGIPSGIQYQLPSSPAGNIPSRAQYQLPSSPAGSEVGEGLPDTFPGQSYESRDLSMPSKSSESSCVERQETLPAEEKVMAWDCVLPRVDQPPVLRPATTDSPEGFSSKDLVGAMQNGAPVNILKNYLDYYDNTTIGAHINDTVEGFPSIFYAVETNDIAVVRIWVSHGAEVNVVHEISRTPLIAFAICHGEVAQEDTSQMVATLLSLGASPTAVPSDLYSSYIKDPPTADPKAESIKLETDTESAWCTDEARKTLSKAINLTHRYYLHKAATTKKPSRRHKQVAKLRSAEPLLGIQYFLIGQIIASARLLQKLLAYLMLPSKKPLVIVFAGPSGHGKTELARRLGHLLSLDLEIVDCTIVHREVELFGPRHPYTGADRGTPLNNFLARNSGERCIVFLDEFEKTTREIHQALLIPFDNGEYQDRRHLTTVDCSKTIWILATNALDDTINGFCEHNKDIYSHDEAAREKEAKRLSKLLKDAFLARFDAPITGRVTDFIPFLPFSKDEQAVVAHKFLLELREKVRQPIRLSRAEDEQLLGNVRLLTRRDGAVCQALAESEYHPNLGARSLHTAVKHEVEAKLLESYLQEDEEILEDAKMMDFVVSVKDKEIVVERTAPSPLV